MESNQILLNIEFYAYEAWRVKGPRDLDSWFAVKMQLVQLSVHEPSVWFESSTCDLFKQLWSDTYSHILAEHAGWTTEGQDKDHLVNYIARVYEILVLQQLAAEIYNRGCKDVDTTRLLFFQKLVNGKCVHQGVVSRFCFSADTRLQRERQELANRLNSLVESPDSSVYLERLGLLVDFCKGFRAQDFSPVAGAENTDLNSIQGVQSEISSTRSAFSRVRKWSESILSWPPSLFRTTGTGDGTHASSMTPTAAFAGKERSTVATSF
jgi:hypothetical protein